MQNSIRQEPDNQSDFDKSANTCHDQIIETVSLKDLATRFMTQDNDLIKHYVSTQTITNTSN